MTRELHKIRDMLFHVRLELPKQKGQQSQRCNSQATFVNHHSFRDIHKDYTFYERVENFNGCSYKEDFLIRYMIYKISLTYGYSWAET